MPAGPPATAPASRTHSGPPSGFSVLPRPDDRRVWLVAITPEGAQLAAEVNEVDQVLRAELRRGLGREERQALAWVMTRLQQNLATAIAKTPISTISTTATGEQP